MTSTTIKPHFDSLFELHQKLQETEDFKPDPKVIERVKELSKEISELESYARGLLKKLYNE